MDLLKIVFCFVFLIKKKKMYQRLVSMGYYYGACSRMAMAMFKKELKSRSHWQYAGINT